MYPGQGKKWGSLRDPGAASRWLKGFGTCADFSQDTDWMVALILLPFLTSFMESIPKPANMSSSVHSEYISTFGICGGGGQSLWPWWGRARQASCLIKPPSAPSCLGVPSHFLVCAKME